MKEVCGFYGSGEATWQVLKMYDVSGKLFNGIKSMYDSSLVCITVKDCIMSHWFFNMYMDAMIKR